VSARGSMQGAQKQQARPATAKGAFPGEAPARRAADAELRLRVERFFGAYVRALDDRRFDDWLALFTDDAFYGVVRHLDFTSDNHLYIIGESMEKLRNRIEMGVDIDRAMQVHLLTGILIDAAGDAGKLSASANFAVFRVSAVTYTGQYRFELVEQGGMLKLARCVAVVANDKPTDLLYVPI
jgi:3-phenylpropionate/cinnamic acid dioxygenase small subunit